MTELKRIVSLLYRPLAGQVLTPEEQKELEEWVARSPYNRAVYNEVMKEDMLKQEVKRFLKYDWSSIWKKIMVKLC